MEHMQKKIVQERQFAKQFNTIKNQKFCKVTSA